MNADRPLSVSRAQARLAVDQFVARFDPSYRLLAYHAALPLMLTPELLNYLRTTFLRNQVSWVAEADLLLSNLCQQVGYELYVMETEVRAYLLDEMHATLGSERMQAVARLLIQYVRHLARTNPSMAQHELQSQQWAAMVYLDDQRPVAVREIARSFQSLQPHSDTQQPGSSHIIDRGEFVRLSELTQGLAHQLEAYPELVRYARQVSYLLRDEDDAQQPIPLDDITRPVQFADVALPPLSLLLSDHQLVTEPPIIVPDQDFQYDVFISYTQGDRGWVINWLLPQLAAAGLKIYSERDYPISEGNKGPCRYILVVLTPNYLADKEAIAKLRGFQARDISRDFSRIFMLLLEPCQPPLHTATLPYADLRQPQDWNDSLQRVVEAVQSSRLFTETWPTLEQLIHTDDSPDYQYDVYISFSLRDQDWVRDWLVPQLESARLRVCLNDDIGLGDSILDGIEDMIATSRYVMAVLTPHYVGNSWSRFELKLAQAYERITSSWRIMPLLLQPCVLPPDTATRTLADLTEPKRQDTELRRVIVRLQRSPMPLSGPDLLAYAYDAFISYSRSDQDWVTQWLLPKLESAGLRICIDVRDFDVGVPLLANIESALALSHYAVLVLSADWVASQWSLLESLVNQPIADYVWRPIPIMLRPCDLPAPLGSLVYVDFTQPETGDVGIQRLVRALQYPQLAVPADTSTQITEELVEMFDEDREAELASRLADLVAEYQLTMAQIVTTGDDVERGRLQQTIESMRSEVNVVWTRWRLLRGQQPGQIGRLSQREHRILLLMAQGILRTKDIADQLTLSRSTVTNILKRIRVEIGVKSRAQAVAYAIYHNLDRVRTFEQQASAGESTPSLIGASIFISYRRDDAEGSAGRLYDSLAARFGENQVLMDIDIKPGVDFVETIKAVVLASKVMLVVIGRNWLNLTDTSSLRRLNEATDIVRLEIAAALKNELRVIPVLVDGASIPRPADLPDDLRGLARRYAIELSNARWHFDVVHLIEVLEKVPGLSAETDSSAAQRVAIKAEKLGSTFPRVEELRVQLQNLRDKIQGAVLHKSLTKLDAAIIELEGLRTLDPPTELIVELDDILRDARNELDDLKQRTGILRTVLEEGDLEQGLEIVRRFLDQGLNEYWDAKLNRFGLLRELFREMVQHFAEFRIRKALDRQSKARLALDQGYPKTAVMYLEEAIAFLSYLRLTTEQQDGVDRVVGGTGSLPKLDGVNLVVDQLVILENELKQAQQMLQEEFNHQQRTKQPIEYYSVFISYSSKDEALAKRLHADLQAAGVRCWFAPEDLKIGDSLFEGIDQGIRLHEKLLLILSESSVTSRWVQREVKVAQARELHERRQVLFLVRIDNAVLQSAEGWAAELWEQRHISDFRRWKDHDAYQAAFARLLRDLRAVDTSA